jgi:hypothetical protein
MTELILGVEAGELGGLLAAHEKVVLSWLSTDTSNLAAQNRHSFGAKKAKLLRTYVRHTVGPGG